MVKIWSGGILFPVVMVRSNSQFTCVVPAFVQPALCGVLLLLAQCAALAAPGAPQPLVLDQKVQVFQRSERQYALTPSLRMQRADGASKGLKEALSDGRPVVMSFMYSSCATVCPLTNQVLVDFERLLGSESPRVNIVSISIDPDHDSVKRLSEYAKKTGAKGSFYTSDPASSESVQRIFDVWRGDKMNHQPVFLLATHPDRPWVRLDGLVGPRQLLDEYRRLLAQAPAAP